MTLEISLIFICLMAGYLFAAQRSNLIDAVILISGLVFLIIYTHDSSLPLVPKFIVISFLISGINTMVDAI